MQDEFGGALVDTLLQPLPGASGPCGPSVQQDDEFFELQRAAQGKPETQFSEAVPPNWQDVQRKAEGLLHRSRDLHAAILWARAGVAQHGFGALAEGLRLVEGLLATFPEHVHPLPDGGDPYPRMNALATLADPEGLLGDLRRAPVFRIRSIGEVRVRDIELALRLLQPRQGETPRPREQLSQMLADAVRQEPSLRVASGQAVSRLRALAAITAEQATAETPAPDWKPLERVVQAVESLMPVHDENPAVAQAESSDEQPPRQSAQYALGTGVHSREDALRAIDMVCEFLERTEPTNPAPLFLRRARRLVTQSFLQLVKELAPDALSEVARVVGVNPDTVSIEDTH